MTLVLILALAQAFPMPGPGVSGASGTPTPAYVQSTSNCDIFGAGSTTVTVGGTTSACPGGSGWATNVGAGHLIAGFIWRHTGSGTLSSVSDGGDSCAVVNASGTAGTDNAQLMYGFYCYNVAGGSKPTVTATFTVSENLWYVVAHEVSGIATTSPLDNSVFVGMAATLAGTNAATTGTWTTSTSGDYILGGVIDDSGALPTFTAGTSSQTWTVRFATDNTNSEAMTTEDGVQTTASASTVVAFSWTGGAVNPLLGAMAFKP